MSDTERLPWLLVAARWVARAIGAGFVLLIVLLVLGSDGLPPIIALSPLLIIVGGIVLGFFREGWGAAAIFAGVLGFHLREYLVWGRLLGFGALHLALVPAILFAVLAWWRARHAAAERS